MRPISFDVEKTLPGSLARAGYVHTPHGDIATPAFVAVGTKATVKGILPQDLSALGVQTLIANTYHLYLSPGESIVQKGGGVGEFMHWPGPTMTDSGGFQVFSLGAGFGKKLSKFLPEQSSREESVAVYSEELATSHGKLAIIDEDGVSFTSHIDGSLHRFTPERSIEIQHKLGADIMFAFDECTSPEADWAYQKEAMDRTHRWASRSLAAHRQNLDARNKQGLYGIVQGGRFEDLRKESARTLAGMDFDGYGIGGSFSKEDILGILDMVTAELPVEKPRHLLGIGEPEDIFIGVRAGIDTFDCVLPTRNGRTGTLYTHEGQISIENATYKDDFSPIEVGCACMACIPNSQSTKPLTRAYLHHLFHTKEMLGPILATQHNLFFLATLTRRIRESILTGEFEQFMEAFLGTYKVR